jgi:4-hydroxybenzoate polyprenyltransferase
MKPPSKWPWQRKSIQYLLFAALCVTWTGFTFNSEINFVNFLIVTMTTVFLVLFVYGFDDAMDSDVNFAYFNIPSVRWLGLMSVGCTLLTYFAFGSVSFISSLLILFVGTFYSFRHDRDHFNIRLKSFFGLKNFLIGLGWGLLVFLGSNHFSSESVLITFLFFTLQVTIGSIIRDLDDIEEDRKNKISTFPIVLGLRNTALALQGINLLSGVALYLGSLLAPELKSLWMMWVLVVIYRFGLIELIRRKYMSPILLQQFNILACSLVFAGRITQLWIF